MPIDRVLDAARASAPDLVREALLELVGACVATNADGVITQANDDAAALMGVPASALLVGKPIQALTALDHRRDLRRRLLHLAEGPPTHFTARFVRRGGVAFDAEVRAARLDAGTLVLAFRDITADVQNEAHLWELNAELEQRIVERTAELELLSEELEQRRAYLETIVQHLPAGVVIADATGELTMANDRSREISGAPLDASLPLTTWTRMRGTRPDGTPYELDEFPLQRALSGEEVRRERVTLEALDGKRKQLEVNAAPVRDPRGNILAAVALFQDITAEDARLRAAAEFVANAAHELRTPLAAIVSGVDVLEAGAKDIPAERDRFLAHIGREAGRLARLSSALLQLARLQSGVEEPRAEIIPLAPVLAAVAGGLRPADGVRVNVRCPNDAAAIASRGLLEQALTSIATNAARYTDAGRITLSVAQPNGGVRIRVRDTGRGMQPDALAHAGQRFYRGNPSAGPTGFGLGLAIARESVEAMGGSLVLASEPGEGTTADILLPSAAMVAT